MTHFSSLLGRAVPTILPAFWRIHKGLSILLKAKRATTSPDYERAMLKRTNRHSHQEKEPTEKRHTVYSPLVQQILYNDREGHRFVVSGKA